MLRMRLAQAWRRRGMRAVAVTLVVPGALAVAVAVVLLGGGLRGLGAFGQVVTGPQVPASRLAASTVPSADGRDRLPTLPTVPRLVAGPAAAPDSAPVAGAPGRLGAGPVGSVPPRRSGASPAPGSPAQPGAPSAPPSSEDVVHQTGRAVADMVGQAPGPAGPAGHDAVTTVMTIIPPPPGQTRAAIPQVPLP
jgi:hypothetical protein